MLGRAADALISIPHLMFALVVVAAFGTSLPVLILMAASATFRAPIVSRAR